MAKSSRKLRLVANGAEDRTCDLCGQVCKTVAGLAAHKRIKHEKNPPRGKRECPVNFPVSDWMREYCVKKNHYPDLESMTEEFLDYHRANGTRRKDWQASWRTWFRNDIKFHGRKSWQDGEQLSTERSTPTKTRTTKGRKQMGFDLDPELCARLKSYSERTEQPMCRFVAAAIDEKLKREGRWTLIGWLRSLFCRGAR